MNLVHIFLVVASCILLQFAFKWTVGNKITSKEDMMSQSRKDYHMLRRLQHMSTGFVMLLICAYFPEEYYMLGFVIGTTGFFLLNLYRFLNPSFNEKYIRNFGFLLRPHEINNMPGALYFLIGSSLACFFFEKIPFFMALMILSFGDPFASLCGIYFRSPKITKDKTIAGTLGCGMICAALSLIPFFFHKDFEFLRDEMKPWQFAITTLMVSMLAEIAPSSRTLHFEDNVSIPVYSGLLFTAYFKFVHPLNAANSN